MDNLITGCDYGIKIYADNYKIIGNYIGNNGAGIHIANSFQIFVSMNNITNNSNFGINFAVNVGGGEVVKNTIANNEVGIHNGGGHQKIYLNNFINNSKAHYEGTKFQDAIYPLGGNYYSDYNKKYPNATVGNLGIIWETPYSFYALPEQPSQDNYPLVKPVSLPTIIPEFPSWIILPLFLIATLFAIVLKKKLFHSSS